MNSSVDPIDVICSEEMAEKHGDSCSNEVYDESVEPANETDLEAAARQLLHDTPEGESTFREESDCEFSDTGDVEPVALEHPIISEEMLRSANNTGGDSYFELHRFSQFRSGGNGGSLGGCRNYELHARFGARDFKTTNRSTVGGNSIKFSISSLLNLNEEEPTTIGIQ